MLCKDKKLDLPTHRDHNVGGPIRLLPTYPFQNESHFGEGTSPNLNT